jgi:sugar porter (SP) family MFS transporter
MDLETRLGSQPVAGFPSVSSTHAKMDAAFTAPDAPRRSIYLPALVAAMGGLLFGFDTAVINGAIVFLKRQFSLSASQTELAASSILVGCALGTCVAGLLSDRFGRKRLLIVAAALFAVSSIGASVPVTLAQFVAARLVGGLAIGIASMVSPLYIAEISPSKIRGRLVALNQLALVFGILLAFSVNYTLAGLCADNWRWMFASAAVPSFLFLFTLLAVPESPRWLVQKGRTDDARTVLTKFMNPLESKTEFDRIFVAVRQESGSVWAPGLRKPLVIAVALAVFQQITGINTIMYYGSLIFLEQIPKQSDASALLANIVVGAVNLVGTIFALAIVDRLGRRPLLLATFSGMALSLVLLALSIHFHLAPALSLLFVLAYVACFAIGVGPTVWIVMAEIFPTKVRGRAMSIATTSLWLACLLSTSTFLTLVKVLSISGAFLLYAAISIAAALFVVWAVPETKQRSLEEIEAFWRG